MPDGQVSFVDERSVVKRVSLVQNGLRIFWPSYCSAYLPDMPLRLRVTVQAYPNRSKTIL